MSPQRSEQVTHNIWLARATIPGGVVCLYIIRGSKLAIVDTGFANNPEDSLAPALDAIGLRLDEVDFILNTHGHPDHLGGNSVVKDASGATVHLHKEDLALADGPEAHLHSSSDFSAPMRALGWEDEIAPERLIFGSGSAGR